MASTWFLGRADFISLVVRSSARDFHRRHGFDRAGDCRRFRRRGLLDGDGRRPAGPVVRSGPPARRPISGAVRFVDSSNPLNTPRKKNALHRFGAGHQRRGVQDQIGHHDDAVHPVSLVQHHRQYVVLQKGLFAVHRQF